MSRPPDWHRRLRELEQRLDNQTTDISRLWQGVSQMPEMPGGFTPMQVPPSWTTPPPTTTPVPTTSTTAPPTTTTTSGPTTTPNPGRCTGTPNAFVGKGFGIGCWDLNAFYQLLYRKSCMFDAPSGVFNIHYGTGMVLSGTQNREVWFYGTFGGIMYVAASVTYGGSPAILWSGEYVVPSGDVPADRPELEALLLYYSANGLDIPQGTSIGTCGNGGYFRIE